MAVLVNTKLESIKPWEPWPQTINKDWKRTLLLNYFMRFQSFEGTYGKSKPRSYKKCNQHLRNTGAQAFLCVENGSKT